MYAFNSAAIFLPGHPYIESTTVLSDISENATGDVYARCTICTTDYSGSHSGRNDVMKHVKGKHHQEMAKAASSSRSVASLFKPQVS